MNFSSIKKMLSPLEILIFVVFMVFVIVPINIPTEMSVWINSSIGLGIIVILTIYMFFYFSPILGIFTIYVAYELLRRASVIHYNNYAIQQDYNEQQNYNQPDTISEDSLSVVGKSLGTTILDSSLEEEVIITQAPVGQSTFINLVDNTTSYSPVSAKMEGTSSII